MTGTPVTTTDRAAQSTIYWTPYLGNQIGLYTSSVWTMYAFAEVSFSLTGLTSGANYDVFLYDNSGTLTIVLSAAWTSATARHDALGLQDGVLVLGSDASKRYLGTLRTTGTTTTEDSGGITGTTQVGGKRFLWNQYNQVRRTLNVIDTTATWAYSTGTIRQAHGVATNQVEYVTGDAASSLDARVICAVSLVSNSARAAIVGVGIDSTTVFAASGGTRGDGFVTTVSQIQMTLTGSYSGLPGLGYHAVTWLENGSDGTSTFLSGTTGGQSGLSATIFN